MTDPVIPMPPRRLRSPHWHRDTHRLYVGDAREVLAEMPDRSADCIVTSPPYWGKRDYGMTRQYGREPDPASYVATLRATFTEARRVLADDGTCWLNLGDSYSASGGGPTGLHTYLGRHLGQPLAAGVPAKNLLGLPWRVAFALQDEGWILRNAIVWHKPNAMPESVRDRLNCRYELLYLLVKQATYWFDLDPVRIPATSTRRAPTRPPGRRDTGRPGKYGPHARQVTSANRYGPGRARRVHPNGRNPGDVWAIPTRPYAGPHFAAFPIDLPTRCIAAGCKPGGTVLDPFTGSGTTGLAAHQLGRSFTGIELSRRSSAWLPTTSAKRPGTITQVASHDRPGGTQAHGARLSHGSSRLTSGARVCT